LSSIHIFESMVPCMYTFTHSIGLSGLPSAAEIRQIVFVDEQGFSDEYDDIDPVAHHLVLFSDGKPAATARLFCDSGTVWHIGRMAVLREFRGIGLGAMVMSELEKKAAELGATEIVLSSQKQASGFYEKLGYEPFGEEYLDQHCPHISMRKFLS